MSSTRPDETQLVEEIIHQLKAVCQLLEVWLTLRATVVPAIDADRTLQLFEPTSHRENDDTVS